MPVQNTDRTTQWLLDQPNETWLLTKNAKITTTGQDAIFEATSNNDIVINGDIKVSGSGYGGIRFDSSDTSVNVGKDSFINANQAFYGIYFGGAGSEIVNKGVIRGAEAGIAGPIWADITNFGTIGGDIAIAFNGDGVQVENHGKVDGTNYGIAAKAGGADIVNHAGAQILGPLTAILLLGTGDAEIVNRGKIDGGTNAIQLDFGGLHLVNKGTILGDIVLGDGTNFIDTRKGEIKGTIEGESGDDTILVAGKVKFVDDNDADGDRVNSWVSYKLGDFVEELSLQGSRNINGTGTELDNYLAGNSGKNHLRGGNGEDALYGNLGDDVLTGGGGEDVFHFEKEDDIDRITDFEDGADLIETHMVASQQDFDDLSIKRIHGDVVINFGGGDKLIIEDTLKSEITYDDFV